LNEPPGHAGSNRHHSRRIRRRPRFKLFPKGVSRIESLLFEIVSKRRKGLRRAKNGKVLRQFCAGSFGFNFVIMQRGASHHLLLSAA
jgi:hypothetical protein